MYLGRDSDLMVGDKAYRGILPEKNLQRIFEDYFLYIISNKTGQKKPLPSFRSINMSRYSGYGRWADCSFYLTAFGDPFAYADCMYRIFHAGSRGEGAKLFLRGKYRPSQKY